MRKCQNYIFILIPTEEIAKKKKKRLGHGEMGEPQAVSQENENEENAVGKRPVV